MRKFIYAFLFLLGLYLGIPSAHRQVSITPSLGASPRQGEPLLAIHVCYAPTGEVLTMDLEEYVKGVVASEMPASAGAEALKAQAVVARTNAVRRMSVLGGSPSRADADVSSDHKVDQAWNPVEVLREKWGPVTFWLNWSKIEKACDDTSGLILMYEGSPCEALYHSTCAGHTEASKDVWGRDVPYLRGVDCSFCNHSPYNKSETVSMSLTQLSASFSGMGLAVPASSINASTVSVTQVSATGRVKEVVVCGNTYRGVDFRAALNLRSTLMSWTVSDSGVVFRVTGYGHGVGMCQYGADGMAKQGRTFQEILSYYYPGTHTARIFEE